MTSNHRTRGFISIYMFSLPDFMLYILDNYKNSLNLLQPNTQPKKSKQKHSHKVKLTLW